nr:hypothetical protein [Planctomycetota bacterium]
MNPTTPSLGFDWPRAILYAATAGALGVVTISVISLVRADGTPTGSFLAMFMA